MLVAVVSYTHNLVEAIEQAEFCSLSDFDYNFEIDWESSDTEIVSELAPYFLDNDIERGMVIRIQPRTDQGAMFTKEGGLIFDKKVTKFNSGYFVVNRK